MSTAGNGTVWSFGFGSNMNIDFVQDKKGLVVLSSACASLPGWKVAFNLHAMDRVEPSFANAVRAEPADEIHGVVIQVSAEDGAKLDSQEGSYAKKDVEVMTYDGRTIAAYIYTKEQQPEKEERPCSRRYLNILVTGAEGAGLKPEYIAKLAATPTYVPLTETLQMRASIPPLASLPPMSVEELAAFDKEKTAEFAYTSVLGYVLKFSRKKVFFRSHLSRDITARASREFRGLPLDTDDDMGRPPFRLPSHMDSAEEVEFVSQWLDHYLGKAQLEGVVAFVAEYREQSEAEGSAVHMADPGSDGRHC